MPPRTLAELIDRTAVEVVHGSADAPVAAITEDSRQVTAGSLFVARPGTAADGRRFISDAVRNGAVAVLSDRAANVPKEVAFLAANAVPLAAAQLAERFYDHPSRSLRLIGVTGTNGKTTTAHLIHQILTAGGMKCGLIGTVQIDDGGAKYPANLTTPSAIEISALQRKMVDAGCSACVMEVSSHALHQKRVAGLAFDIGIFTNLTGDHLDYHGSMEEYAASKAILFELLPADGHVIVNADDPHAERMTQRTRANVIRCSLSDDAADCFADAANESMRGIDAELHGPWGRFEAHLPLIGRHNAMNALQAAAACHATGVEVSSIRNALTSCAAPPGRLEPVTLSDAPFAVFVDYAHTDDALENVLRAVKPLVPNKGKLRVVFGCGGDRDRTKRPRMAQVAWKWADEVIITSDNPRTEDPDAIISEIYTGVPAERTSETHTIADRRVAIHTAIERAQPNDIILIAGKGHEDYQIIGREKRPFDDRVVAREAIAIRPAQYASTSANFFDPDNIRCVTGGEWILPPDASVVNTPLSGVGIDSRGDLTDKVFVAIKGEKHDGHDFLEQAVQRGARLLIVEKPISSRWQPTGGDIGVLRVENTRTALAQLATTYRRTLTRTKVIAITGSSGKTTTKRLVHAVLSTRLSGTSAPLSFNNEIGVPLTILAAKSTDDYLVVEIGTNAPGEIGRLAQIAQPDIVVITSIGRAHLAGLGSIAGIAREKAAILSHMREDGLAMLTADAPELHGYARLAPSVVLFGESKDAQLRLTNRGHTTDSWWFEINGRDRFEITLPGKYNACNAIAAVAVAQHMHIPDDAIHEGLRTVKPEAMRMCLERVGMFDVCNDAYNANPESMAAALETFIEIAHDAPRRVVILGDMLELGPDSPQLHAEIGRKIIEINRQLRIDHAILIGEHCAHTARALEAEWPPDRITAVDVLSPATMSYVLAVLQPGDAVLIKGSRGAALERIVEELSVDCRPLSVAAQK